MIFVRYYLWVAPNVLLAILLAIAWRRGWHKRSPIFFTYALFSVLQFALLFVLSRIVSSPSIGIYHWTLAISSGVQKALELGVLFELAGALLLNRVSLTESLRRVMKWTLAALVLISAVASAGFAAGGLHGAVKMFSVLDFCSSLVEAGLLVAIFLFSRALHISWRTWPTGVALGLGVSACMNLSAAALRAGFGKSALLATDMTDMASFHVAVVVWLAYLFVHEQSHMFVPKDFGESEINFWNQEAQRMARQ